MMKVKLDELSRAIQPLIIIIIMHLYSFLIGTQGT